MRAHVVAPTSEPAFNFGFSLAVALSLVWMGCAYAHASRLVTRGAATTLKPVAFAFVLLAFVLFGSFAFQRLIAPLKLDRKYRRRHGAAWSIFVRQTSYLPFVAILQGRNGLVWRELPWLAMALGVAAFGAAARLRACVVSVPAY